MTDKGDKLSTDKAKSSKIKDVEKLATKGKIGIRAAMDKIKKIDPSLYPTKNNTLGLSPAEKRDIAPKRVRQKQPPSGKIKGERNKDLARLEKIKEKQKKEKQKKENLVKSRAGGNSVLKKSIRKNKNYIAKKI